MNSARTRHRHVVLPAVVTAALVAWVVLGHAARARAEAVAADFMSRLHEAQQRFHARGGGFASALDSLTTACPSGEGGAWLEVAALQRLRGAGYEVMVRSRDGSTVIGSDCHGRPTVADYYAAVQPGDVREPAQRAFAITGAGRIFVFVDGIAPIEPDMAPGGLATPLEDLATFRIP